jgi:type IV pilus assembly protein PilC
MSRSDDPRRPRPAKPGDPAKPARPKSKPAEPENVWRRPTEPDEIVAKPRVKSAKEPSPATGGPKLVERILFGRVSSVHLANFCRQFATYSDAGVDLIKSLQALEKQYARTALGPILGRLIFRVRQGDALSDAMEREPEAFDKLFLSMIRVAEARGGIPETMRGLANHYDARVRLIRQARSAMIYPIIVMIVAAGVIALLSIFLLPMFASLLKDLAGRSGAASLPWPSRFLMGLSSFVAAAGWWLVPLLTVGSVVGLFQLYKTSSGKAAMDEVALHVPVLGKFLRLLETTRFSRTLSALLNAGVDMASSLDLTSNVLRLTPYRRAIAGARAEIVNGGELSEILEDSHRFNADVIAIVNSGEETGKLPESLEKLADDYEERVTYMVKNLGSLVQPLIMIMLGGVVLFIILAVILPYISLLSSLGGG